MPEEDIMSHHKPRLSVRAVIIKEGYILLSQYEGPDGYWYVCPGGGVEHGETIKEAFHREMLEEVGVECEFTDIAFIREIIASRHETTNLPDDFHQVEMFVHSSLASEQEPKVISPDHEQVGIMWVPLDELKTVNFFPKSLVEDFINQSWQSVYYGELR